MKKQKLLALIYSQEDRQAAKKWLKANSSQFEITHWSNELTVPIQAAVAHFCEYPDIDGLLIDDYQQYDPIALKRIVEYLTRHQLSLYSTCDSEHAVFSTGNTKRQSIMQLHISETPFFLAS